MLHALTFQAINDNVTNTSYHHGDITFVHSAMWSLVFINVSTLRCFSFHSYDIILTSETVYSRKSYDKLHDVMDQLLSQRGVAYPLTVLPFQYQYNNNNNIYIAP